MAARVKADCGANSIEHSYALTHLTPIGLRVIGYHLGSACSSASGSRNRSPYENITRLLSCCRSKCQIESSPRVDPHRAAGADVARFLCSTGCHFLWQYARMLSSLSFGRGSRVNPLCGAGHFLSPFCQHSLPPAL